MFRNREDAGAQVAERLKGRPFRDPLVLAIPRGGVVVGAALARALGAELDVVLSRKLRAPGQPEWRWRRIRTAKSIQSIRGRIHRRRRATTWLWKQRQSYEIDRRNAYGASRARINRRAIGDCHRRHATGSTMIALKEIRTNRTIGRGPCQCRTDLSVS